jgi:hypothetical protein
MIDPLGPDPTDPAVPPRHVGEIVSKFELPEPPRALHPRKRYANYDRPEALARPISAAPASNGAQNGASAPRSVPNPAPAPAEAPTPGPVAVPVAASTALVRPVRQPEKPSKFQRAIGIAKTVLPLVGKMLPLLEGNVVSAATNLLTTHPVPVDLKPLEEAIARLQSDQRALTFHTGEHKRALRRLEDEFATLGEAVQKNAEQQAELTEQVLKLAKRTRSFMRLLTILLVVSILFTVLLCVRIAYIIRF